MHPATVMNLLEDEVAGTEAEDLPLELHPLEVGGQAENVMVCPEEFGGDGLG
jgi:hypothetical protein